MPMILGLDLSLLGTGMVALDTSWNGDWSLVQRHTAGEALTKDAKEPLRIGRLKRLADEVVAFARTHGCTHAVIEQYAFTSQLSHAHALGELGGVVKHQLAEKCGLVAHPVPPASARKLVLGKVPRKDAKIAVVHALTRMGMPLDWGNDEADAFVVANYEASELGGFAFVVPAPVEEKRSRTRAA